MLELGFIGKPLEHGEVELEEGIELRTALFGVVDGGGGCGGEGAGELLTGRADEEGYGGRGG